MSTSFPCCRISSKGFTLVELLVVVAVITIITAFMLFNQSRFDSSTLVRSLAYSVGLDVRQAQLYGTSVKGSSLGTQFNYGYGINFSGADTKHIYTFVDADSNGCRAGDALCSSGAGTEDVSTLSIGTGYQLGTACAFGAGAWSCTSFCPAGLASCTASSITSVTLVFRRPNPDACIADSVSNYCAVGASDPLSQALVEMVASSDAAAGATGRMVKVTTTGQITVCQLGADPSAC